MAGRYDRINGAWEKVRKRYDKISGAWTPVKKRFDKANGVWAPSYSGSVPISFSQYLQYNCYPTFTPSISGQVYRLAVNAFEGVLPGNAGARFTINTNETVAAGQSMLYVPDIQLYNLDGRTLTFCVEPSGVANGDYYVTDINNKNGNYIIPAHTFTIRSSATGPFTFDLFFACATHNYFSVNNSSFEIDFSKVVWLPTNTNLELQ